MGIRYSLARKIEKNLPIFLVAPCLVYLISFGIFPMIFNFWMSTQSFHIVAGSYFIGLGNYSNLMLDHRFWNDLEVTLSFVAIIVTIELLLGLGLALLLSKGIRGQRFLRVLFLLPMMATPIAVGYIWRMMFHETRGPINHLVRLLGLQSVSWTTDPHFAAVAIIVTDIWQWTPFMMLILLAGLQSLPIEPYEAALIDGSSRLQTFRYITLPLLSPIIVTAILLRTIDLFKLFDIVYILTRGGPGIVTETIPLYGYYMVTQFRLGYASSLAVVLNFTLVFICTMFIRRLRKA